MQLNFFDSSADYLKSISLLYRESYGTARPLDAVASLNNIPIHTVNVLAKERGLTLAHDKKLRLFKMIYKHCLIKRELDMPFINKVFALAA